MDLYTIQIKRYKLCILKLFTIQIMCMLETPIPIKIIKNRLLHMKEYTLPFYATFRYFPHTHAYIYTDEYIFKGYSASPLTGDKPRYLKWLEETYTP